MRTLRSVFSHSSVIAAIEYNPDTLDLKVELVGGHSYTYQMVPALVVADFINAPSPGKYYNSEIKGRYS
jgi:hypothetical protein